MHHHLFIRVFICHTLIIITNHAENSLPYQKGEGVCHEHASKNFISENYMSMSGSIIS